MKPPRVCRIFVVSGTGVEGARQSQPTKIKISISSEISIALSLAMEVPALQF